METGTPSMTPHFTALFRAYPDSHDEPNKIPGSGSDPFDDGWPIRLYQLADLIDFALAPYDMCQPLRAAISLFSDEMHL